MGVLLWIVIPLMIAMIVSGVVARRSAPIILLSPIVIAFVGAMWINGALSHYERATGRERTGLIGYHYSMPEWGFQYAPNGRRMERWSFDVPTFTTLALLLASAIVASVNKWHELRGWPIVGLWVYHSGCAITFLLVDVALWIDAASVFI